MLLHFLLWSVMVLIIIRHPDRISFFLTLRATVNILGLSQFHGLEWSINPTTKISVILNSIVCMQSVH